jgi:hypothetical protein
MTVPFYAYQQGKNRLSTERFAPEGTDVVVGVPFTLPDIGITVRLVHATTEGNFDDVHDTDAISVVLPVNEAVAMALGVLAEAGTLAAHQVAKAFNDDTPIDLGDLGLKPQEEDHA